MIARIGVTYHLWDKEQGKEGGERAGGSPEEEDLRAEIGVPLRCAYEVGSDSGDDLL